MNTFEIFSLAVCFCALLVVSFFLSPLSHSEKKKSYPTTWRGFSSWIVDRVAMIADGGHAGEKDEEDKLKDEQ